MRRTIHAALFSLFISAAADAAPPEMPATTDAKAAALFRDYYSAYAENDYDKMASFYAEDAVFEDPTSDLFARGVPQLREAMNSLDAYRKLHWRFHQIVRDGDVIAGQASVTGEANGAPFATRFATMMTMKDGKIVRHIDYIDNRPPFAALGGAASKTLWDGRALDDVAGKATGKKAKRNEALRVASDYLGALDRIEADAVGRLYSEDAIFEDPTFRIFMRGRAAIDAYARSAFEHYQYVRFMPQTIIASADGAVIEGTGFGVADGFQAPMRFMTFLRVADGKITSHADFFDYGEYERLTRARDLIRDTNAVSGACAGRAAHHLGFWTGEWVATIANGTEVGRNRIERAAGGCAILEHWDGILASDMKRHFARGVHWIDGEIWRHAWIDDNAGTLEFKGRADGDGLIYAPVKEPDPSKRTRMTIRPLDGGRVEQFGEESTDRGKTWSETFRIFYARAD